MSATDLDHVQIGDGVPDSSLSPPDPVIKHRVRAGIPSNVVNDPDRLMPAREAAALLGVGLTSFDAMVRDGRLPAPIRIGQAVDPRQRHRRWRRADILEIIRKAQYGAAPWRGSC